MFIYQGVKNVLLGVYFDLFTYKTYRVKKNPSNSNIIILKMNALLQSFPGTIV
jgi:hypothetical protein